MILYGYMHTYVYIVHLYFYKFMYFKLSVCPIQSLRDFSYIYVCDHINAK